MSADSPMTRRLKTPAEEMEEVCLSMVVGLLDY